MTFDEALFAPVVLARHAFFATVTSAAALPVQMRKETTFESIFDRHAGGNDDNDDDNSDALLPADGRDGEDLLCSSTLLHEHDWRGRDLLAVAGDNGHVTLLAVLATPRADSQDTVHRFVTVQQVQVADPASLNYQQLGRRLAADPQCVHPCATLVVPMAQSLTRFSFLTYSGRSLAIGALQDAVGVFSIAAPVQLQQQRALTVATEAATLTVDGTILWHLAYLHRHPVAVHRVMLVAVGYRYAPLRWHCLSLPLLTQLSASDLDKYMTIALLDTVEHQPLGEQVHFVHCRLPNDDRMRLLCTSVAPHAVADTAPDMQDCSRRCMLCHFRFCPRASCC